MKSVRWPDIPYFCNAKMKGENKLVKRQTVWLLTMLSLMIVLSAYYMLSDKEELAYIDENEEDQSVNQEQSEATSDVDIEDVRNVEGNDFFTTIRMELQDKIGRAHV